jgi:DNA topoisomerase-3
MKVVIAEKPSVARDIASFLRAGSRHDGYFEGGGYQVTWAFGHLAELKKPEDYHPEWKAWALADLPIIPTKFEVKLTDDRRASQQFAVIKRLFHAASELICATDAGREGELIFRYILSLAGCEHKPFRRLWLSSLTPAAIREAFGRLRPGADYDNLYAAARCRSEADWIVGLNATRCLTIVHREQGLLWSAGRVQTPVLAMIVRRDDEIRTFQPEPFWELLTRYRKTLFHYTGERCAKEADALQLLQQVQGRELVVQQVQRKEENSQPPQLYDLTELQRDMNRRYGFSAEATLQAAQLLYEEKLITYPRTDSRYLSDDLKRTIPDILRRLEPLKPEEIGRLNLTALTFSGRIINNSKVTDHHAIIPTGSSPGELKPREQKVYGAVLTRLIAVFYPPCVKEVTTVEAISNHVPFRARGVRIVSPGWTVLDPRTKTDEPAEQEEGSQRLPAFRLGERGSHEPLVKRGETTPPKPFTENTLLGAMETAGKLVDDEQLKEALKQRGLGTPATRAAIIETLLKRGYIIRVQKTLAATDLGRYLAAVIHDERLKSPELTGEWEAQLRQIEAGRLDPQRFMAAIADYTREIVRGVQTPSVDPGKIGECPRCGRAVIEGKRDFGCSGWREGCAFILRREYKSHTLTTAEVRELVQRRILLSPLKLPDSGEVILALTDSGAVVEICPPTSKSTTQQSGKRRRTINTRGKSKKPSVAAAETALGKCPLCGSEVVEQKQSYRCGNWRAGCPVTIWKTIAHKRLTPRMAKTLLEKGQTSLLKGFKSKSGKAFSARLKLVDGEVRMDFES